MEQGKSLVDDSSVRIALIVMVAASKSYSAARLATERAWSFKPNHSRSKFHLVLPQDKKLKLRGKGNMTRDNQMQETFFVLVDVAEHPLFKRRGADLICEVPLLFTEAVLGTRLNIPTLTGLSTIVIPAERLQEKYFVWEEED